MPNWLSPFVYIVVGIMIYHIAANYKISRTKDNTCDKTKCWNCPFPCENHKEED